jgi:hypothetical protein
MVEKEMENAILAAQKSEITEHFVYQKLSQSAMGSHNKSVIFTFYVSVAKDISFWKRFSEMAMVSFGIATLTFFIGFFVRMFLNIDL